jgi:rfaE bifunctional protein kinase chain/domain
MDERRLRELLAGMTKARVLVVGDYYLDAYWFVDNTRSKLSLETPWHVNFVVDQRYQPGASGTITNNLCALGVGTVSALGVIGEDSFGTALVDEMAQRGTDVGPMIRSSDRLTPIYLKPIHRGYGDIEAEGARFDIENFTRLGDDDARELVRRVRELVPGYDAVIWNDHDNGKDCGVISSAVLGELNAIPLEFPEPVFLADSRARIGEFRNVIIKPNRFEAKHALEPDWTGTDVSIDEAKRCGAALCKRNGKPVFTTLGEHGLCVHDGEACHHVPVPPVQGPLDIVGAGDSTLAGITAALCAGASLVEAAEFGALVASITITKLRDTGTASPDELLAKVRPQAKR